MIFYTIKALNSKTLILIFILKHNYKITCIQYFNQYNSLEEY